jgi:beta-glucosidase
VGPLAHNNLELIGSWSGDGHKEDVVTVLDGIRSAVGPATRITYAPGCNVECSNRTDFGKAVAAAQQSDAIVAVVGEAAVMSGEASSRASIDLPGYQLELLQTLAKTQKPLIVVLMNGRPLILNWLKESPQVGAILETWFGGTQAGPAIADVLFGDVNPGGKLAVSFPYSVGQIPVYYAHKSTGRPPTPKKYTSKYLDIPNEPLYPFGYGLSYTQFQFSDLKTSTPKINSDENISVKVTVSNVGPPTGDEVVQIYVQDVASSITRPVQELRRFQRVTLASGESRTLTFTLTPRDLAFYDENMNFRVEPGTFVVTAGSDSRTTLQTIFEVTNEFRAPLP